MYYGRPAATLDPFAYDASGVWCVIAIVLAIVATVLICALVMPEKKKGTLNRFFLWLHEVVNFKSLLVEKLLKVLYVLCSCFILFLGLIVLFVVSALPGLLIIVIGLVVTRVGYELVMLLVVGVDNLVQINRKLPDAPSAPEAETPPQPAPAPPAEPVVVPTPDIPATEAEVADPEGE